MSSQQEWERTAGTEGKLTVEERGLHWGERARERMLAGKEPVVAIVRRTEEYDRLRGLPSLSGGQDPADVRFQKLGGIYYTTWRGKRTITAEDGRRSLKPPKKGLPEYEVLLPRRHRQTPGYLENLPLKSPVQELLFHRSGTIEEAISSTQHILEEGIREQAQQVIAYTAELSRRFIERGLSKENLEKLAEETGQFLKKAGLANPTSPDFRKVMERLQKACEPDSLGRINTLVSRMRTQSAYVWAVKRLVVGSFVGRKHGENNNVLVYERETTRWALENARRQLDVFLFHEAFRHPEKEVPQLQAETMVKVFKNITYNWLVLVRVAPYLAPARVAAINLVGCQKEKKKANRAFLGEWAAEILFTVTPVTELLKEKRFVEARERIKGSCRILDSVLAQYASIG